LVPSSASGNRLLRLGGPLRALNHRDQTFTELRFYRIWRIGSRREWPTLSRHPAWSRSPAGRFFCWIIWRRVSVDHAGKPYPKQEIGNRELSRSAGSNISVAGFVATPS
jgi:hypothetical protein